MNLKFRDILAEINTHRDDVDPVRLKKIYRYAKSMHAGQLRKTGDPYITHSIDIAYTLASWHLDQITVEAGLLHDLPEMSNIQVDEIGRMFGDEVAGIVDGVNLVGQVRLRGKCESDFLENLRKMFVYMAKDIRAVLVRLADRRHNIVTLHGLPIAKQRPIALETMEVYAPLAERMGMGKLKGELEDLTFPYVYPAEYEWVSQIAKPHLKYSSENVLGIINKLKLQLSKNGISCKIGGRPKHRYSLYKKLIRPEIKGDISKIYDLVAIRIITKNVQECYSALGVVHQYWKPVPYLGISDFIAQPKPNGYQSIHTKIFDNNGNIVEIQIRSEEMHLQAEYGAAAHFAYALAKNSGASDDRLAKGTAFKVSDKMAWVNQLFGWQQLIKDEKRENSLFRLDALAHHIYVFSPTGDVYDLPEQSTPIDYAYAVHSDLGNFIQAIKINGRIAPIDRPLKSGDVVEVIKTKTVRLPSKNWYRFVKTHKAKVEIKKTLTAAGIMI